MIELRKVSKVYDDGAAVCRALQEVDLTIEKGEMTAIIGASGSGKVHSAECTGSHGQCDRGAVPFEWEKYRRVFGKTDGQTAQ